MISGCGSVASVSRVSIYPGAGECKLDLDLDFDG